MVEDLQYMQASNVNVSNFVSVKVSNQSNYLVWKAQMICLLESQLLRGIVERSGFPTSRDKIKQYDSLVKGWILSSIDERVLKNFIRFESAGDVWKKLESLYEPETHFTADAGFVFRSEYLRIPEIADEWSIKLKNSLYDATFEGCWWKAKALLKNRKYAATLVVSENSGTMLHVAVVLGHNYFLEKLLNFVDDEITMEMKDNKGRTPLHVAAMIGNKHAAQLLVERNKRLLNILDYKARSPLDVACTNEKLDTFVYLSKFGSNAPGLNVYRRNLAALIVSAIFTKQYNIASTLLRQYSYVAGENYQILLAITKSFPSEPGFMGSLIYPSLSMVFQRTVERGSLLYHYNAFYEYAEADILRMDRTLKDTCCGWLGKSSMALLVPLVIFYTSYEFLSLLILVLRFPFCILYFFLWKALAIIVPPIKNVEKMKKEYSEAKQVLSLICESVGALISVYRQPILEAVRLDAYVVVDEFLYWAPHTINFQDEEGHNIIQLAIKSRSEKVYNLVYHIIDRISLYRTMKDASGNNLFHLASRLAPSSVLDRTIGAAIQLQRELQWHYEVQKFMTPSEQLEHNMFEETPAMLFNNEHHDLMKRGETWMKTTAESCSITAALIVTVVFAAAITTPGGSDQQTGIPVFRKEIAFTLFAISNAFSLFTAATALLLFLSILTSRFSQTDFLVSLPTRLILGLFALFLATIGTIVAFGAVLFLVVCEQRPWMLAPIVGFVCLPISVIVTVKVPLLMDFLISTYFPIFGKQTYIEGCKTNRKNLVLLL